MSTKLEDAKLGDVISVTSEARVIAIGYEGADDKNETCTKVLSCVVTDHHSSNYTVSATVPNPNYVKPTVAPVEPPKE